MTARVRVKGKGRGWWWSCAACGNSERWVSLPFAHIAATDHAKFCDSLNLSRLLSDLGELEKGYRGTAAIFTGHQSQYNRGYAQAFSYSANRLSNLLSAYREGQ